MPNQSELFYIKDYKGSVYEIPEENLDAALASDPRNEVVLDYQPQKKIVQTSQETQITPDTQITQQSPEQNPGKFVRMKDSKGGIYEIPEHNIKAAQQAGGVIIEEPDTWGQFGARSAKTIAAEVGGGLIDTAASVYNIPAMLENSLTPEMKSNRPSHFAPESPFPEAPAYPEAKLPIIPSATHAIENTIDDATGGYTKTKEGDSFQAGLRTATGVLTPGGLAKTAVRSGAQKTAKVLNTIGTTNPTGVAAAGAAGYGASEASKAGLNPVASAGVGLAAGAGVGAAIPAARALDVKLAIAKLTGNSPKNIDLEAVKAAENAGLEYMNTLVNKSSALALADQFISKTPYFGTRQAIKQENINKSFSKNVDNAISEVGAKIIESDYPLDSGSMVKDVFNKLKEKVTDTKNSYYTKSQLEVPESEKFLPLKLAESIQAARSKIVTLKPSNDQKFVLKELDEWESLLFKGEGKNRKLNKVNVRKLIGSKASINDTIDWDVKASGPKKILREVQHGMKEDLISYGLKNPKWYKSFEKAEKYYAKYLGDKALGSESLLKKIFSQEDPEKILPSLNKISDFRKIDQSLQASKTGKDFFNSIKREKLTELLLGKNINVETGHVNYGEFSKSIETPSNRALIKYLAGDKYQDLLNLNKYSRAAVQRNQRIPNTSGTAPTKVVLSSLGSAITGGFVGGIAGAVTGGVVPLVGITGLGQIISWLINNKAPLRWGVEAAKKQAAGDIKAANIFYGRIERNMINDLGENTVRELIALSHQDQPEETKQ